MKNWQGADYGFLAPPRSSNEPRPPPDGSRYSASFPVKYLGSGPVQHYADYEGCLQIMNKHFITHQLNSKRRMRRRRSSEAGSGGLVLTFTPQRLFIVNKDSQVLEEMCKLEAVYLVHPHPTKDRLLGVLTDNWMSGTLHCSVYVTLDHTMGSDVLYGFRKACRIWTELNQVPRTTQSDPGPSSALLGMPSGEYDKLESKSEPAPTGVLISLKDSKQTLSPSADTSKPKNSDQKDGERSLNHSDEDEESVDLNTIRPLLFSQSLESSSTESECNSSSTLLFNAGSSTANCKSPAAKSPLLSTSSVSESRPLLHNESNSMESRPLLLGEGSTSTNTESNRAGFQTQFLYSDGSSFELLGEYPTESGMDSQSLAVRKVSFAPSTISSEMSEAKADDDRDENAFSSKLISSLNGLKGMMNGKDCTSSRTSAAAPFPRLFPREYPPPTSPPDTVHPQEARASQPHPSLSVEPPVCDDLIDLTSEPSFKTVATNSGPSVDGTNSLSQFHSFSFDSIHRIEKSSSTPALFIQPGWHVDQTSSADKTPNESSNQLPLGNSPSSSAGSTSYTSVISSACSSLSSFENSSSSGSREVRNSDGSSLQPSICQFLSTSSSGSCSEWTSQSDFSAISSQNILTLLDPNSSKPQSSAISSTSQDSCTDVRETSKQGTEFKEQAIQTECQCNDEDNSPNASHATLTKLFQDLASQTSQVSSQFSVLQKLVSTSSAASDPALVKLFEEQASQTATVASTISEELSKLCLSQGTSATSSHVTESASSGGTSTSTGGSLANLFAGSSLNMASSTALESAQTSSQFTSSGSTSWSETSLPHLPSQSSSSSAEPEYSLPAALLSLTQSALCTSFTVNASKVIDLPSLMETLKHVTSLLASSHAILDLSLATLKEKIASQPSNICVCTCQPAGGQTQCAMKCGGTKLEDASASHSEPLMSKPRS